MTTNDGREVIAKRAVTEDNQKTPTEAKKSKQSSLLAHFTKKVSSSSQPTPSVHSSPVRTLPHSSGEELLQSEPISEGNLSLPSTTNSGTIEAETGARSTAGPKLSFATRANVGQRVTFSEEELRLFQLELVQLGDAWLPRVEGELKKAYFRRLKEFLAEEHRRGATIYPPADRIYSWARLCPFPSTRVVLLGQDPYHNEGQAMGLCFSVPRGVALPPSLMNIYKELSSDIDGFRPPRHGDLSTWAQQGVLLLNTSLTVRAHEPASHAGKGWEIFTDSVIQAVNAHRTHIVFLLWGNHAQRKAAMIDRKKHLVLMAVHPSPLSAARGFFGCKHFSKTNEYLVQHGQSPINWNLPE